MNPHRYGIALLALLSIGAAPLPLAPSVPPGKSSSDEASVLAAMDLDMTAISAKDVQAMASMQTPDGMMYRVRAAEGRRLGRGGAAEFLVDRSAQSRSAHPPRALLESHGAGSQWNRRRLAPYEFWIDGKTSHCGVDVFDFVKVDGVWRVSHSMWTFEPDTCADLRPPNASMIRPAP